MYWNGKSQHPPKESDVYSGLIELATYTRFETNIIHRDVIDAMMRQPFSNATRPFSPNKITGGTVIKAVDYDLGINGAAYFDNDTANYRSVTQKRTVGNRGGVYRNDGVDIRKDSALYENYYVSDIENGEWLQYTINTTGAGNYDIEFTVASTSDTGSIRLITNGQPLVENIAVPNSGDLKKWQTFVVRKIPLHTGSQALRIYFTRGGFNLKSLKFVKSK